MTDGLCPFAEQIRGGDQLIGWSPGYVDRVGFCDHTAGGFFSTMTRVSFWNDPNGDGNTSDAVSVHFAISRQGDILQVLNIFDTAFAQGRLGPTVSWPPYAAMGRRNPNGYLISTEHEDAFSLNGRTVFIPGSEWTGAMYDADLRVKRWCVEEVARVKGLDLLRFGLDSLAGHHMFDSVNRAECPGRFWRDQYQRRLFDDLTGGEDVYTPHNAVAQWFEGREFPDLVIGGLMQVRNDLSLPMAARLVRLDVYMGAGGLLVRHPSGEVAGVVEDGEGHAIIDVRIGDDGTCLFETLGAPTRIRRIGALGYWP